MIGVNHLGSRSRFWNMVIAAHSHGDILHNLRLDRKKKQTFDPMSSQHKSLSILQELMLNLTWFRKNLPFGHIVAAIWLIPIKTTVRLNPMFHLTFSETVFRNTYEMRVQRTPTEVRNSAQSPIYTFGKVSKNCSELIQPLLHKSTLKGSTVPNWTW